MLKVTTSLEEFSTSTRALDDDLEVSDEAPAAPPLDWYEDLEVSDWYEPYLEARERPLVFSSKSAKNGEVHFWIKGKSPP